MAKGKSVIPVERIASLIYVIRGEKVILDSDLAKLYRRRVVPAPGGLAKSNSS